MNEKDRKRVPKNKYLISGFFLHSPLQKRALYIRSLFAPTNARKGLFI